MIDSYLNSKKGCFGSLFFRLSNNITSNQNKFFDFRKGKNTSDVFNTTTKNKENSEIINSYSPVKSKTNPVTGGFIIEKKSKENSSKKINFSDDVIKNEPEELYRLDEIFNEVDLYDYLINILTQRSEINIINFLEQQKDNPDENQINNLSRFEQNILAEEIDYYTLKSQLKDKNEQILNDYFFNKKSYEDEIFITSLNNYLINNYSEYLKDCIVIPDKDIKLTKYKGKLQKIRKEELKEEKKHQKREKYLIYSHEECEKILIERIKIYILENSNNNLSVEIINKHAIDIIKENIIKKSNNNYFSSYSYMAMAR